MQMNMTIRAHAAALLLAVVGASAHAGLFDDDEARRAILDLRSRITQAEEQSRTRASEMAASNAQLSEQMQQMRRSLVDMNNQLESMRNELARLRGADEQRTRELSDLQRGQKDMATGMDQRLGKFGPQKVSVDGQEFTADMEEKTQYEGALDLLRNSDFAGSSNALAAFRKRYPNSGYDPSARFWLGNALYGKRDYKEAINTFRGFVSAAPDHPRAPEALLAAANCQLEMKDTKAARTTLNELVKAYPNSEAAQAGKERLVSLK
jgi:tol-pal system protein YbgF